MYKVWASVNPRTQTPTNAVWAMTALAFLLGLPMIWSNVAFQAIGSVSSIALWLSCKQPRCIHVHIPCKEVSGGVEHVRAQCRWAVMITCKRTERHNRGRRSNARVGACADGIPIVLRVWKHKNFEPGPFKLGAWQLPVNLTAIAWVITSTVRRCCAPFHSSVQNSLLGTHCFGWGALSLSEHASL